MSLPGDCKQLMHYANASCVSVPQATGMRGCCSLLTFPQPHLKTWVITKAGSGSHFRLCGSSWCQLRHANNCDLHAMLAHDNGHMQRFAALSKPSALGHQLKGADNPVEAVLVD